MAKKKSKKKSKKSKKSNKKKKKSKSKKSGKKSKKNRKKSGKNNSKKSEKDYPTLKIQDPKDIAQDFSTKVYEKFDKLIKSIILFGSQSKGTAVSSSDIDLVIVVDDASIEWDQELISWYREELGKLIANNPYKKDLHVNTIKLTTWWKDLMKGDPVVINMLRFGQAIIDFGGFFNPLKVLLQKGYIKSTPESIYTALQRTPAHIGRSKASERGAIEGLYWALVDSSQAALMSAEHIPPSPEHIPKMLKQVFVDTGNLKMRYVEWYKKLFDLHKNIIHGNIKDLKGKDIDAWQERTEEFVQEMTRLVRKLVEK